MATRDESGYVVFSGGEIGQAHVLAHRYADAGQADLGRRCLGRWLEGRSGAGSDWAHIQFHQALFELEDGDWDAAHRRFTAEILPAAVRTDEALTDAPALAWRLGLSARGQRPLGWAGLRETALRNLGRDSAPFAEVHHLLALAGSRDTQSLTRWLRRRGRRGSAGLIVRIGEALRDYTQTNYRRAADVLSEIVPEIASIGGSRAQNQLFPELQARLAAA
jgi:hypothetical protein